ncbi:hypothetical protein JXB41_09105 [Candidatus Woesearchaeota archaeon]|nr:hypothetical protein [Candidatus Woesearchaeota archaeon]
MLLGVIIVLLLNNLSLNFILIILSSVLILGFFASILSKKFKIPVIIHFLELFDREDHKKNFPGKGAFFYIAGSFFTVLLFEKHIASASILILAFGDSVSHIIGRYYGRTKMIIHSEKLLEGTLSGIITATVAASFFVELKLAFAASVIAMFFEAFELEFFKVDDNLTIPVVAGIALATIKRFI